MLLSPNKNSANPAPDWYVPLADALVNVFMHRFKKEVHSFCSLFSSLFAAHDC